ncbi:MAG: M20/M25/M40 family metallo-hydrolase [Betaproteobacteria bacterium]|nr:MAG: M20/M25/M40 family metallo-hydrolase [Betaproteobacteria bacterium]
MVNDPRAAISSFVAEHRDAAERFLAELVRIPSDNPPGDCAAHAARAAALLEQFGFAVERHAVPKEAVAAAIRKNARAVLGEEIPARGVPLYTDARHYGAAGVPTVLYGAGPRTLAEANGHRADENLKLDDLHRATEVVALSLYDLLSAQA